MQNVPMDGEGGNADTTCQDWHVRVNVQEMCNLEIWGSKARVDEKRCGCGDEAKFWKE